MVGSRVSFEKLDFLRKQEFQSVVATLKSSQSSRAQFILRLYQQAKQLSQIVAYIWRWSDDSDVTKSDVANKLKEYFEHPTKEGGPIGGHLKELFKVVPNQGGNKEAKLLYAVFGDPQAPLNRNYIFPIFDETELGISLPGLGYAFTININSFHGKIVDATSNEPQLFSFDIPYPPRPTMGKVALPQKDLDNWIENREEYQYFSENPFIPTSCS